MSTFTFGSLSMFVMLISLLLYFHLNDILNAGPLLSPGYYYTDAAFTLTLLFYFVHLCSVCTVHLPIICWCLSVPLCSDSRKRVFSWAEFSPILKWMSCVPFQFILDPHCNVMLCDFWQNRSWFDVFSPQSNEYSNQKTLLCHPGWKYQTSQ